MNQSTAQNKLEIRDFSLLLFSLAAILLFVFQGKAQNPNQKPTALRGAKALEFLRHNGFQTSLPETASGVSFTEEAKLLAADGAAQDQFGYSVAISGNTAVVGMPRDTINSNNSQGAVYVYTRSDSTWTQQQKLVGSDSAANDQFGFAVAVSGNTIAVGRYNTVTGVNRSDGKVYIFTRAGSTWTETQTIVSGDIAQGDSFGYALALEGNTLAVGARNKQQGTNFFQGAAYIFTRATAGANFVQEAKLTGSDTGFSDFFGESVALSGETALIGSVTDFGTPNANGKAYVFVRNGASWSEQQILQAQNGSPNGAFGVSVSVSGDYALVGANTEVVNSTTGELGAAYVFVRNGTVWTQQQRFTAKELTPRNDRFGYAVTIKGDTLAVGSPAHEIVSGIANHGAVYVYQRSGASWVRTQKLIHEDPAPDALGQALAFDGETLLAGAPSKNSARGAAYVFKAIATNGQLKLYPPEVYINPLFGFWMGASDDTIAIGSNLGTYIYTKRGEGWEFTQKLPFTTESGGATNFTPGTSIAFTNGMMIVGANNARVSGVTGRGMVLIYARNQNGIWIEQQRILASDGAASDNFGSGVAASGNTLVVGASNDAVGANTGQGSAYVFVYDGSSWTEQQKITATDGAASDRFGYAVDISGETIVVGAYNKTINSIVGHGAAYVFTRSGNTWSQQRRLLASGETSSDQFGVSVAIEGETIAVGAPFYETEGDMRGAVFAFTRSGENWSEPQRIFDPNGGFADNFGVDVKVSGERIFVGASSVDYAPEFPNTGAVYVYRQNGQSWQQQSKLFPFDANRPKQFGFRIALTGEKLAATAVSDGNYGVPNSGSAYVLDITETSSGAAPGFDFDGDGRADTAVFRPSNGVWYLSASANNQFSALAFGQTGDVIVPADYDGDGKTDHAVYRNGYWYLQQSTDGFSAVNFGLANDIPVPADFDGDGRADIAVFRPSNGTWYRLNSSNGEFVAAAFGQAGDRPVPADFDGDGRADIAVYRPSAGSWYRLNSSDNQFVAVNFGIASDKPVAADFDGDGRADIAVFRDGYWYRLNSSNNEFVAVNWGLATDAPVPADFDGDGRADIAVFRDGTWYINQSSGGALVVVSFGQTGDLAVPNAFIR